MNAATQRSKKCGQVRMSKTPTPISGAWAAAVKYLGAVICAGQQCSLTYRLAYHKFSHLIMVGVFEVFPITVKAKGAKTLPESGTRHRSVGGAMPICVYTQKAEICVGTQNC